MQTNNIKTFARKARLILLDGVAQRLKYWGFDEQGRCTAELTPTAGGYILRGQVFSDPEVPEKWNKLKKRLLDRQAVEDVCEQAAYTWFNRLMAIQILENNTLLPPQLAYAPGTRTPTMVQQARLGNHPLQGKAQQELLNEYLRESKEEQAFGLLLTRLCTDNRLLREVFGHIDDHTGLLLPHNLLQKDGLMDLLHAGLIADEDYREVELIGWLYQFYIADKKDKVFADFKKNIKARAEDIPAATQIFTPRWIVKYMVENTLGQLYLDYEPHSALRQDMKYLVENTAAEKGPALIQDLRALTLLDPAAGSGHILVTAFDLLFRMYREAGHTSRQAVELILAHNLWGLDIDERAVQLARFAILLKAAQYDAAVLDKGLIPHVYSFPEAAEFSSEDIHRFLGTEGYAYTAELVTNLELLRQGRNIGSALKLKLSPPAREYLQQQYARWTARATDLGLDLFGLDLWKKLKPFLEVMLTLGRSYAAVVANPPYMGQKNMNEDLKKYINAHYPLSKSDLFAVFMEVCLQLNAGSGLMGMINQHSWMFLSSYEKLREMLLTRYGILNMLHLGPRTFDELSGEVVQSTAFVLQKAQINHKGTYYRLVDYRNNAEKEAQFLAHNNIYPNIPQSNFSKIPGSPIAYWVSERETKSYESLNLLKKHCYPRKGIDTGDNDRFLRFWPEINIKTASIIDHNTRHKWMPYNKGGEFRKWYGNREVLINWDDQGSEIKSRLSWKTKKPTIRNSKFHFKEGFSWTTVSSSGFSCRFVPKGCLFDNGGCTLFSDDRLLIFGALLNSCVAKRYFEFLSPTLNFQPGDIGKMLFYEPRGKVDEIENTTKLLIKISTYDWDSRETSWDFEQSPLLNGAPSLSDAYARWLEGVSRDFFQLHANEEELNRIFIEIYGLQEELTPEVPLKDITILQEELDRGKLEELEPVFRARGREGIQLPIQKEEVLAQFVSYCVGVMLGRYRLGQPGLHIAHPKPTTGELAPYTFHGHPIHIDQDAILPIMGSDCHFADDVLQQLNHLLLAIWGEDQLTASLNFLQEGLGMGLSEWLTRKFWPYHTAMYKKKPIYWMFCSNLAQPHKAAFRVLCYMHPMDRFTVQRIQRNYLHPHQEYIRREIEKLKAHESTLDRQESRRLEMLQAWDIECRDYHEVLKEMANRQIEFDLDDGVTVNYAKFEGVVARI